MGQLVTITVKKDRPEDIENAKITVEKYRSLERRYNSLIDACNLIEAQNEKMRSEIINADMRLVNAQKNVEINQKIVMDTITSSNNQKDSFLGEIAELKSKLSRLG